jgi:hypothetical protein
MAFLLISIFCANIKKEKSFIYPLVIKNKEETPERGRLLSPKTTFFVTVRENPSKGAKHGDGYCFLLKR